MRASTRSRLSLLLCGSLGGIAGCHQEVAAVGESPSVVLISDSASESSMVGRPRLAMPVSEHDLTDDGQGAAQPLAVGVAVGRQPLVEALPATIVVPKGVQRTCSIWLVNNEEEPIRFLETKQTCGCVDLSSPVGELEAYGALEVLITVAAVDRDGEEKVTFPFVRNQHSWELQVKIRRK